MRTGAATAVSFENSDAINAAIESGALDTVAASMLSRTPVVISTLNARAPGDGFEMRWEEQKQLRIVNAFEAVEQRGDELIALTPRSRGGL